MSALIAQLTEQLNNAITPQAIGYIVYASPIVLTIILINIF